MRFKQRLKPPYSAREQQIATEAILDEAEALGKRVALLDETPRTRLVALLCALPDFMLLACVMGEELTNDGMVMMVAFSVAVWGPRAGEQTELELLNGMAQWMFLETMRRALILNYVVPAEVSLKQKMFDLQWLAEERIDALPGAKLQAFARALLERSDVQEGGTVQ